MEKFGVKKGGKEKKTTEGRPAVLVHSVVVLGWLVKRDGIYPKSQHANDRMGIFPIFEKINGMMMQRRQQNRPL